MTFLSVVLMAAALSVMFWFGRKSVPVPQPTPPKPFGLEQVETVKAEVGGLSAADAKTLRISVAAAGLPWTYPEDVEKTRKSLATTVATNEKAIESFEAQIAKAETRIGGAKIRDAQVAETAAAFGL